VYLDTFGSEQAQQANDAKIAESRRLDAPLMDTGGGVMGNIVGNIVAAAPSFLIPGVNTVVGAGLLGATMGALQSTMGDESRLMNVGKGAVGAAAGQFGANKIAGALLNRASNRTAQKVTNAPRDRLIQKGIDAGYRFDPMDTNPTITTGLLRSVAGKTATEKTASTMNQATTNKLSKMDLGLRQTDELTDDTLRFIRSEEGKIYKNVGDAVDEFKTSKGYIDDLTKSFDEYDALVTENAGDVIKTLEDLKALFSRDKFDAKNIMHRLRALREDAADNLSAMGGDSTKNRSVRSLIGRTQNKVARTVEDMIAKNLKDSGQEDLYSAFVSARQRIAKTHTYEKALLPGGDIDAKKIASQLGKKPLSNEGELIAQIGKEFPRTTQRIPGAADPYSVISIGVGAGALGAGNAPLAAMVAARPLMRAGLLSNMGQRATVFPNYNAPLARAGAGLLNSGTGQYLSRTLPPSLMLMPASPQYSPDILVTH